MSQNMLDPVLNTIDVADLRLCDQSLIGDRSAFRTIGGPASDRGFYLASNKTWYDYLKRERSKARYMGLDQEFISPEEVARRHPLINPKYYSLSTCF